MNQFEELGLVWCPSWADNREWHLQTKLGSKTVLSIFHNKDFDTGFREYKIKSLGCHIEVITQSVDEAKTKAIEWFRELLANLQKVDPQEHNPSHGRRTEYI